MPYPKIVYNPGSGNVTLQFGRPATNQCAYDVDAIVHRNIASSGNREDVVERIDVFIDFDMEWVGLGTDVEAWNTFVTGFALLGGKFNFFPDASQGGYTTCWIEDTNWRAAYKSPGQYSFKMKLREVPS